MFLHLAALLSTFLSHVTCMAATDMVQAGFDEDVTALLQFKSEAVGRDDPVKWQSKDTQARRVWKARGADPIAWESEEDPGVPNSDPGDLAHPYNSQEYKEEYGSTVPEIKPAMKDSEWYHDTYATFSKKRHNDLFELSITNPQADPWPSRPGAWDKNEAKLDKKAEEKWIKLSAAEEKEADNFYKNDFPYQNGDSPEDQLDKFSRYRSVFDNENPPLDPEHVELTLTEERKQRIEKAKEAKEASDSTKKVDWEDKKDAKINEKEAKEAADLAKKLAKENAIAEKAAKEAKDLAKRLKAEGLTMKEYKQILKAKKEAKDKAANANTLSTGNVKTAGKATRMTSQTVTFAKSNAAHAAASIAVQKAVQKDDKAKVADEAAIHADFETAAKADKAIAADKAAERDMAHDQYGRATAKAEKAKLAAKVAFKSNRKAIVKDAKANAADAAAKKAIAILHHKEQEAQAADQAIIAQANDDDVAIHAEAEDVSNEAEAIVERP